jgi:hypothetical protein
LGLRVYPSFEINAQRNRPEPVPSAEIFGNDGVFGQRRRHRPIINRMERSKSRQKMQETSHERKTLEHLRALKKKPPAPWTVGELTVIQLLKKKNGPVKAQKSTGQPPQPMPDSPVSVELELPWCRKRGYL